MAKENKTSYWRIILYILIIIALVGKVIYDYLDKNQLVHIQLRQEQDLNNAYFQLDSIQNALEEKIVTLAQLGAKVDLSLIHI